MFFNDGSMVTIDLLFAEVDDVHLGRLTLYCFFLGLLSGALLCMAYNFIQSLELRQARKDAENYKKQLDHLRSSALKDTP